MNCRWFTIIALVVMLALSSTGCVPAGWAPVQGSGRVVSQDRAVAGVTGVNLATLGNLHIKLGDQEELRVEAEDSLLPYLQTDASDGRLEIHTREGAWLRPTRPVHYYLTVKKLESIVLSGSGSVDAPDLKAERFSVQVSGSGNVQLGDLDTASVQMRMTGSGDLRAGAIRAAQQTVTLNGSGSVQLKSWSADTAEAHITGSGSMQVAGGLVREQRVTLTGSGDYRAKDVASATTDARITGSGSMTVRVQNRLTTHISGSGSVNYVGDPQVEATNTGSGRTRPLTF